MIACWVWSLRFTGGLWTRRKLPRRSSGTTNNLPHVNTSLSSRCYARSSHVHYVFRMTPKLFPQAKRNGKSRIPVMHPTRTASCSLVEKSLEFLPAPFLDERPHAEPPPPSRLPSRALSQTAGLPHDMHAFSHPTVNGPASRAVASRYRQAAPDSAGNSLRPLPSP